MGRPKKEKPDGHRAKGIQAKKGMLYILIPTQIISQGIKTYKTKWIKTGLEDTKENIQKAQKMLEQKLSTVYRKNSIDSDITMPNLINIFLADKQKILADTTYAAYLNKTAHIAHHYAQIKAKQVTTSDVNDFLDKLIISGKSVRYSKDIKVLFSEIMNYAKDNGVIIFNPVSEANFNRNLIAKFSSDKQEDDTFFNCDEAAEFIDAVKDHALYELFYLTLVLGLRREEVLGLKWSAIDFNNQKLLINHTVTKGTEVRRLNSTKTESSHREYPLTDSQVSMLSIMKEKELYNKNLFGKSYINNDYIFKHEDGSLYYPDYPSKAFKKVIKAHSYLPQDITFHGLRASCVSILVSKGKSLKEIQKWVGHKDLDTTLKWYSKIKERESKKETSKIMEDLITNSKYT